LMDAQCQCRRLHAPVEVQRVSIQHGNHAFQGFALLTG